MTSDPGPGSNGFPLPPSTTPPPGGLPAYGPPTYGPPVYGQPGWGPRPYAQQPQYGQPQYGPRMLCAQADRDRTMDVLKSAYTEGRLTKTEFDERSARVLAARTYGDLNALVSDLPTGPGGPALPAQYPGGYFPSQLMPHANGYAVGAMLSGFVPILGAVPAIVLGHVARAQIKRTGEPGDAAAVLGLVLGYLWLLVIMIGLIRGGS